MAESQIVQTTIELTEPVQTASANVADKISVSQLHIYYGELGLDGLPSNVVKIHLICSNKDAQESRREITLSGEKADWFVSAVADLALAEVLSEFKIDEGLRK